MITFYQFGNSVCCQKARIVMAVKGLGWEQVEVDLFRNEQYDPAYLRLNPAGVVPTLIDDGAVVTQSTLICEYLDEAYPDPPLMPPTPLGRAQARVWSKIVDEGLHEGVSEISFAAMFRERMKTMTPAEREVRFANVGDPKRRDRFTSTYEHGAGSRFVAYAVAAFDSAFMRMEATLAAGGPWLMGDAPTLADVALMPYVARLAYLGLLDLWTGDRPHVTAWWTAVQDWPPFVAGVVTPMKEPERAAMATHGPPLRPAIAAMLTEQRGA